MSRSHSPPRALCCLLAPLLVLTALLAAIPGCSDGEGTVYTITSEPDTSGGDPLLVFRTRTSGWDDAAQRSFTGYVEVYGVHSDEFLPMGVRSLTVFVRMYSFDGPAWPEEDIEIRSDKRATSLLAGAFGVQVGQDQIKVPETGGTKAANYIACGSDGGTLMSIATQQLITLKTGPVEVELNLEQLQGIAKLLERLKTPPQKPAPQ